MSYRFLLIVFCFSIVGCGETIDARQLEIDNGLFYKKGDNTPFTGSTERFYPEPRNKVTFSKTPPEKIKECMAHFKNGMLHGTLECFSSNDQKIAIIEFKEGYKDGREAIWDSSSGNLLYEIEFEKNTKHGHEIAYDRLGERIIKEAKFSRGKPISGKQWNSSGELTANITYSENGRTGFNVNNAGEANYFNAEKGIVIRKLFMFKEGYKKPEWSDEMRYFGNMEGAYIKGINVESQQGYDKSFDYYDENGNLLGEKNIPQYVIKFGLDTDYINSLNPELYQ